MDQLQRIYQKVKLSIENRHDCDRDIFIVLNTGASDSDPSHCGHHLITILDKVQKSANLQKRDDFPNLVLLQYPNDIPVKATNIVYWNSEVFNEKLTDKLESINKLFDDPSVLNPFEFVNGALSNRYGPEHQYFFLDSILKNHDENHEAGEHSVQQVVQMGSKVFSQFQNFIIVVLLSKYCDGCLLSILNHMTSLTLVKKFVWNLGRGVWCPKTRKNMDLCFSWVGDDGKLCKPSCWRYSNAEESSGPAPPSTPKVPNSSSKKTPVLPESNSHRSKSDQKQKPKDYFGALSSSTSSDTDLDLIEVYRENKVLKKNAQGTRRSNLYSDGSDDSMSYRQTKKAKKTKRYTRENNLKRRSVVSSSSDESDVRPISIVEKRKFVAKNVQKVVRKPSSKEMHEAFIQIKLCFNDAQIVNLPLTREPSDIFCAFCFSFSSNSNHFCSALSEAEKMANKKVNEIMRNVKKLDRNKFEEIKMFLLDEINIWNRTSLAGRMAKRTGKPEKYYDSSNEKTCTSDEKAVHRSKRRRTTSRCPRRQQSDSDDSDMSSPIKKNAASSSSSFLAFRCTSESNKTRYSKTGRPLRKVREAPKLIVPPASEVSQKERKKKEICPDGDCFETVDFQKKYSIRRAVECGFRFPNADYVPPPLPADRSTWSREDDKTAQFGPVYAAARNFRPDYLNERGSRLVKIQQFDWESDSEDCSEKNVPERRSSKMASAKREASTPTTSSKNHLQEALTETHNFLPPLKRSDVEFIDCESSIDGEEYQEEGPSTTSYENPTYYPEFPLENPVATTIPPTYITLSDDEDEMNNNVPITLGDSSDDDAPRAFYGMDRSQLGINEYQGCIQQ